MRAEGTAGAEQADMLFEDREILLRPLARLDTGQQTLDPRQAVAAGRAPAAGFLCEKMFEIAQHAHRAGALVEHDDRTGAEPAAAFFHRRIVHRHIEIGRHDETGGSAAGQNGA